MGNPKNFDDVIQQLRGGDGAGIAVNSKGEVVPGGPATPKISDTSNPQPCEVPTQIQRVVWGGGWWEDPARRAFFHAEQEVMAQQFPDFALGESRSKPGHMAWQGWLTTNYGRRYLVEAVHKPSYPLAEPWVWVLRPGVTGGAPHLYPDGNLCLHMGSWKPYRSTAAGSVAATAEWLLLYDHWRTTGERW